jgi:hypothetical protein
MKKIHVFTSAAFNYIPKVRLLFNSLRELHPEWVLHLALADSLRSDIDLSKEPFDAVHAVADLGITKWEGWSYCHTIVELATAIKPFMLSKLLDLEGCEKVLYMDPDTVAFSRLDDIVAALDHANLVLTPHQLTPEKTISAVIDNEICSLKHGVYNLGFIAVASNPVGKEFAKWWSDRIYHFCRADIPNGLFTDQRWIDLVPAFFEGVAIMRSPRHNVAPWNLTTRTLSKDAAGTYKVDDEPLGFYHFTGFDSGAHRIMASKNGGANATVTELIDWYTRQCELLSTDPLAKVPWAFGVYADGQPISKASRIVYRNRIDLQRDFKNPFDPSGYLSWWNSQGRLEYSDLFDSRTHDQALYKLTGTLTPGFIGEDIEVDWKKARGILAQSLFDPKTGLRIGKRSWEILKSEGLSGLKRRLLS